MYSKVICLLLLPALHVASALDLNRLAARGAASSFAGSPTSFIYPPPGFTASASANDADFPNGNQVGFPGPTPTGDEAAAIATAPSDPKVNSAFPLVRPNTEDNQGQQFNVLHYWGQLSPFHSVDHGLPQSSAIIPKGCSLNQVHLLHRHGARYPTSDAAPATLADKIRAAANSTGFTATGPLEFLNTWTYKLGGEILTAFGREQLFSLGVGFRVKYGHLLEDFTALPVWRTTSQDRMLESALHFAAGFFGVSKYQSSYHQSITIEGPKFNNTLAAYFVCPNNNKKEIGGYGSVQSAKWINIYLQSALKRIQPLIQGVKLEAHDLFAMQQTCAYETVALGYSAFCHLFTEEEWKGYEYAIDLSFWYGAGPGQPTSAAIGLGWVQEFLARLTETPITQFDSSINGTLSGNNVTFPLKQPIFVDATHDTMLSAIYTTLNFSSFAAGGPLPTDHIPKSHSYVVSKLTPFAANLAVQVLSCPASSTPTHIRFIMNDGVVPLTGVKGCPQDKNGLCPLKTYISSMQERVASIDFNYGCNGNYSIPQPDTILDGSAPKSK